MSGRSIGARILRTEDPRLLRGRGEFVDDIRLPQTLHAAFLRSPHAHARILGLDPSNALKVRGVHAVLSSADMTATTRSTRLPSLVPNPYSKNPLTQFSLAKGEVCYVGEAIAIVVADTRYLAEDAAALIHVDYEPLAAVADCRAAIKDGALAHQGRSDNKAAEFKVGYGDVAAAFASATHIFREELFHHRGCGHALETRGVLADWNAREQSCIRLR